ncbi:MAG: DUF2254 domain-containing protein [Nitratireductor sp.]|nr:DUF2254 domain-containing protein [Nitratireductor sp.]
MGDYIRLQLRESLWAPPALAALISIAIASLAYWTGGLLENITSMSISKASLISLLGIFASSMLTVSTFAVSAIIGAASGIANSATPRASRLVLSDGRSQFVLAAFVAAFIYSIVSILALNALDYGEGGRFLLFMGLIAIVAVVLLSFIQWIDSVLKLGRQQTIIDKLAAITIASASLERSGTMGGIAWDGDLPENAQAIHADSFGYITAIDMKGLQKLAEQQDGQVILPLRTGDFADPGYPLAYFCGAKKLEDEDARTLASKVMTYRIRNEDNDLRFNIINLSEVADRALSPAINDPGTAIIVLDVMRTVLHRWCENRRGQDAAETGCDRVAIVELTAAELMDDAFTAIARDGAGMVEVASRLQNTLASLALTGERDIQENALNISHEALELAVGALPRGSQRENVERLARRVSDNARKAGLQPD